MTAKAAHVALVETAPTEDERQRLLSDWEGRTPVTQHLKQHRQVLLEIILSRHVENYLSYLSSLLFEIFTQRPETLRSSGSIDIETALQHNSINDLVRTIAKKKVENLSYSSFEDLAAYFGERFHLKLVQKEPLATIVEAIEIRNISVHNRCIINERYVSRSGSAATDVGKKKELYINYLDRVVPLLAEEVAKLDESARKRLKLKGTRFDIASFVKEDQSPALKV